ncbi:FtsX-like permease family protein [Streptosporangium canum]|uniref:FtsX-like permease family protein n=1 Tax=Streptosporangium canum TaxID=324952 RepID=UPI0036878C72
MNERTDGGSAPADSHVSALLAALRISRRDAWRARGRSTLIVIMIGLPVLAVTAALTLFATRDILPGERLTMELGAADARLVDTGAAEPIRQTVTGSHWEPRRYEKLREPRSHAEIQALIGPGGRAIPMRTAYRAYSKGPVHGEATAHEVDLRDPMTRGMFPLVRGRYPQAADEVAVTTSVKAAVGTTLLYSDGNVPKRVVGTVVERPTGPRSIIGLPGSLIPASAENADQRFWLVDTPAPITWEETVRLNQAGVAVLSPVVLADPPQTGDGAGQALDESMGSSVTGTGILMAISMTALAVIEVALLAGPAFAMGIRRRRRELALISAQGGSARHLKLVVLADGLTLGLVAAALGVALGIGGARGLVSYLGIWPDGEFGPFDVPAGQIALVAALGVFSGVVAAVVPAVQAARANVVAALAGRRAEARDRAGWPLPGLVLLLAGVAVMAYAIWKTEATIFFGGVLGLLGLVMLMPLLVRLIGGLAGRLPLPFRLAVRDASRNRGRTAPAIVAVLAAAAAFSTVAVGVTSDREVATKHPRLYPPGTTAIYGNAVTGESWKRIRTIVEETLPGVPLLEAYQPVDDEGRRVIVNSLDGRCDNCSTLSGPLRELPAGGPDLLRFLLGRTDRAAEAALVAGKAVVFNPKAIKDGKIRLSIMATRPGGPVERTGTVPAVVATVQGPSRVLGVMPVAALTEVGLIARLSHLIVDPAVARPTPEQEQRLSGPVRAVTPNVVVWLEQERGQNGASVNSIMWIMAALSSVVVLGGTFAAAGLAATDARSDLGTLSAIGARPGTRRLVVAGQTMFIAGLGVPLGLLVGLVPGLAMAGRAGLQREDVTFFGLNGVPYEKVGLVLSVPWPALLAVGIGLPLAAALIAMTFTRTRVTSVRRTG